MEIAAKEIGSEFSTTNESSAQGITLPTTSSSSFVFSGRTAIETVIKNTSIHKIAFPSYCCDSMLAPFRDAGIDVSFYDVHFDDGFKVELCTAVDVDAILWCNYFGFRVPMPDLSEFKSNGGIVIEDITHSFMSDEMYHLQSDYLVASLRKWEPIICGGYCTSVKGVFDGVPDKAPDKSFIDLKRSAMNLKREYLQTGDERLKPRFLSMFKEANEWLAHNYSGLTIDDYSREYLETADISAHREIRRGNAVALYDGLKDIEFIKPLFDIEDMDCPLFVPVIIDKDLRNKVRQKLTDNKIYCPIHWPKPNADCSSNLYDMELSLICDQRYGELDMKRIISVLREIN